jgi:phosphoribosylamine--glycine ligase
MKVLVVGSGGREHALAWKIAQSPRVTKLYAAPGNAGIASIAEYVDITADNIEGLADFAAKQKIDLTVVGPEAPLCKGIVDLFTERKLRAFGPNAAAARLEGSKVFCKNLLRQNGIPTPGYRAFRDSRSAIAYVRSAPFPLVVKADGLAAGKGVVICHSDEEAVAAIEGAMDKKAFGDAGSQVVIEEFLNGVEASVISLTDGRSIATLELTQDHKRVYDGDRGPNTGGMGAYSPTPAIGEKDYQRVVKEVLVPTIHALNKEQVPFKGVLYAGMMFTKSGPKVLEFNVRFGDPECQPLMMRLKTDLVELMLATIEERLEKLPDPPLEWDERASVCVVAASGGYPGRYEVGYAIDGLDEAARMKDVVVFHAGTQKKDGKVVTSGGRVLGITALGDTIKSAQERAYEAAKKISFTGMHYRTDIAAKALK